MQGKGRHLFWPAAPDTDHHQQLMFLFFPISPQVFCYAHKRKDRSASFSLNIGKVVVSPPTLKHV